MAEDAVAVLKAAKVKEYLERDVVPVLTQVIRLLCENGNRCRVQQLILLPVTCYDIDHGMDGDEILIPGCRP